MKSIKELSNIKGTKVILRTDYNVPLNGQIVQDDLRIKKSLPTINLLRKLGAKIIIMTHTGRDPKNTLLPVAKVLKRSIPITFVPAVLGSKVDDAIESMKNGDVIMLENLRSMAGEDKNDPSFARGLSKHGDIYVNDAFPFSHRSTASIVGIPKFLPSYMGLQMELEIKELSNALKPEHPFLAILGGAKPETKIPLVKIYLKDADNVFVGGALANNFFRAMGFEVGQSMVDDSVLIAKSILNNKKLILPETVVLKNQNKKEVKLDQIKKTDQILDIGKTNLEKLSPLIKKAKLIIWNGPLGWYEYGYTETTDKLIDLLISSKAKIIIGGGDTALFLAKKKLNKNIFVSTGGGATLEFLSKGTLPGIKALK